VGEGKWNFGVKTMAQMPRSLGSQFPPKNPDYCREFCVFLKKKGLTGFQAKEGLWVEGVRGTGGLGLHGEIRLGVVCHLLKRRAYE
jgi:hypothetical protein